MDDDFGDGLFDLPFFKPVDFAEVVEIMSMVNEDIGRLKVDGKEVYPQVELVGAMLHRK